MKLKYVILAILTIVFLSCRATKIAPTSATEKATVKTIEIIKRDTVIQVKKDSSFYKSFIKCKNGKPFLRVDSIFLERTKYIEFPVAKIQGDTLTVNCKTEARKLFVEWQEKFISEQTNTNTTITLPPKEIEKKLSWWQKLWIALGKILLIILIIFLATKVSWKNLLKLLGNYPPVG